MLTGVFGQTPTNLGSIVLMDTRRTIGSLIGQTRTTAKHHLATTIITLTVTDFAGTLTNWTLNFVFHHVSIVSEPAILSMVSKSIQSGLVNFYEFPLSLVRWFPSSHYF